MVQSDFVQKHSIKLYAQANLNDVRIFQNDLPNEGCSSRFGFAYFLLERDAASSKPWLFEPTQSESGRTSRQGLCWLGHVKAFQPELECYYFSRYRIGLTPLTLGS